MKWQRKEDYNFLRRRWVTITHAAPTHAAYLDLPTRTCDQHTSSHRRPKEDDPKTAPNLEYDVIYKESSPKNSCYDGSLP